MSQRANIRNVNSHVVKVMFNPKKTTLKTEFSKKNIPLCALDFMFLFLSDIIYSRPYCQPVVLWHKYVHTHHYTVINHCQQW